MRRSFDHSDLTAELAASARTWPAVIGCATIPSVGNVWPPVTPAERSTLRCSSRKPVDDLNATITIPASALFASPARWALSAGLSVALPPCAHTTGVRDEFGISHDPALNANNNRIVSVLVNRFLFGKFTVLISLTINSGNQLSGKIKKGL